MKKHFLLFTIFGLLSIGAIGQRANPGTENELAEITRRGRDLADYDKAAWHSTDAVVALSPKAGTFEGYIARKIGERWQNCGNTTVT